MDTQPARTAQFGTELRRRRVGAGLSLSDLSELVHYSRSHLSKVETGAKPPSRDLARRCDAALGCDGTLGALVGPADPVGPAASAPPGGPVRTESGPDHDEADEVWIVSMGGNGDTGFGTVSRRHLLAGGIAGLAVPEARGAALRSRRPETAPAAALPDDTGSAGSAGPAGPAGAASADMATVDSFRTMFGEMRTLAQKMAPKILIPALAAHTHALRTIADRSRSAEREAALLLASRYAEYTGWMAQEAGDDARTIWWTDRAVELATAGGDEEMAAYAMVRRGLVALYRHDAPTTIELAEAALARARTPRVRGLAAQRAAQGHAIAGDYDACFRALDDASSLLAQADEGGVPRPGADAAPVIGTANVSDPVAMTVGWCLFDLGQPDRAAEVLRRELERIPVTAERARARFSARLALALAGSGEPEEACAVAGPVLDTCERVDSATVRTDLCGLARALNRWHAVPAVQETRIRLTGVLHRTA